MNSGRVNTAERSVKIISIGEKSKQNITRDIEVKNNLTIAGGGGDSGKRGLQELL